MFEQCPWIREGQSLPGGDNLDIQAIVQKSERKKTASFIVVDKTDRSRYFVKFCSTNSPPEIRERFTRESNFYRSYRGPCVPALEGCHENFLVLEYVESVTLREWVNEYRAQLVHDTPDANFLALLDNLSTVLSSFYRNEAGEIHGGMASQCWVDRICNLLGSGPKDTDRPAIQRHTSSMVMKWTVGLLKRRMARIEEQLQQEGRNVWTPYVHMDLHGNNIIVAGNHAVYIVDFENIELGGVWITDLLYLHATLMAGLRGLPAHMRLVDDGFRSLVRSRDPGQVDLWSQLAKLFVRAASTNTRFASHGNSLWPAQFLRYVLALAKSSPADFAAASRSRAA